MADLYSRKFFIHLMPGLCTIILGMHRSGTSCLGSLLQDLGCKIGHSLEGPADGNPQGHFEDSELLAFHRKIIHSHTGDPGGVLVSADFKASPDSKQQSAAGNIIRGRQNTDWWGWKEPRTCLFAEFWLEMIPDASIIAIYRHPLEVWDSLLRRNTDPNIRIMDDAVFASYTAYNRGILAARQARKSGKVLLGYATELLEQPQRVRDFCNKLAGIQPKPGNTWKFNPSHFQSLKITRRAHEAFCEAYPESGELFDKLQNVADYPLSFAHGSKGSFNQLARTISECKATPARAWLPVIMAELGWQRDFMTGEIRRLMHEIEILKESKKHPPSREPTSWLRRFWQWI
jgi:O-antigen biosynthesis protein